MKLIVEKNQHVACVKVMFEELDASTAKEFRQQIGPVIEAHSHLILDLSNVTFVDSAGLGALLSCLRRLNDTSKELKICGLCKPVRALFEVVRMHQIFNIYNTQEEALCAFQKGPNTSVAV